MVGIFVGELGFPSLNPLPIDGPRAYDRAMRRVLVVAMVVACLPSAAPAATNGRIVFVRGTDVPTFEIWTMAVTGGDELQLTSNENADDMPEFSPDGTKIVFASDRDGDWDIYVMASDGTDVVQVVDRPGTDVEPTWSPDGTRIAYETFAHDPERVIPEIRIVNADGSEDERLTRNKMIEFNVAWSPDGSRIAFSGNKFKDGFDVGIFTVAATGGDITRVTRNPIGGFVDGHPAWSPNGRWIAFHREVHAFFETFSYEIYKVRSTGGPVTRLTRRRFPDQQPAWSPDGDYIVYAGNFSITTIRRDGSERTVLTSDEAMAHYSPSWQPLP